MHQSKLLFKKEKKTNCPGVARKGGSSQIRSKKLTSILCFKVNGFNEVSAPTPIIRVAYWSPPSPASRFEATLVDYGRLMSIRSKKEKMSQATYKLS